MAHMNGLDAVMILALLLAFGVWLAVELMCDEDDDEIWKDGGSDEG